MIIGKFYPLPKKSNCYFNKCLYIYITFLNIRNITVTDPKPNENIIEFKAGELIYKFDDKSDCAYFLKKGEVKIISEKGKVVGYINEDEVFGEQSILLGTNRTVSAEAAKDCVAIKIPKYKLIQEFNKSSTLIKAILRSTCMRLTNLDNTISTNLNSEDQ